MCPIEMAVHAQTPLSMGILPHMQPHMQNKVAMFDFAKQAIYVN